MFGRCARGGDDDNMGLSEDGSSDRVAEKRFQDLCDDLNMDKNTGVEAWQSYEKINQNYTLEGETLHWLACALYVSCRNTSVPTVDKSGSMIEGNCVSLTRLLQSCNLSLIQFFNKMKKWQDMANLPQNFRTKVDRLERKFAVSVAIFKKFKPIFMDIFREPMEVTRVSRGRKQRRTPCTTMDLFSFCWTIFVYVKGNFPAISDDLVNSYHLLLSCIDLIFSNVLLADRRDLLERKFKGLPENFGQRDYKPPTTLPCIIQLMCKDYDGLILEAKGIKEHWWKPHIQRLFEKKILKGKVDTLSGLLDVGNFEHNSKTVNKAYEEHVLNVGDFDERIFLGEDANSEIGIISKSSGVLSSDLAERMQQKRNLQQYVDKAKPLAPSTPLTGRKFLKEKEQTNITPVSTATQSVSKLQALLSGRKTSPSDTLLEIFNIGSKNHLDSIVKCEKEMGEIFCKSYAQPSGDHPGSHVDFAKKRLQLGESLYYKSLETIMLAEKKRVPNNFDFKGLLEQTMFQKTLFACCLEVVIFSYNSQRTFPWIIDVFNLEPYYFYKVIEIFIRAEDGLSRDVVKHLNLIEEQILESLAWKGDSPLWDSLKECALPVPSCEEVSLPSQMESAIMTVTPVSSPIPHPAVKRLVGDRVITRNPEQSPLAPSIIDCFQSPVPSAVTPAKRRLFVTAPTTTADSSRNPGVTLFVNGTAAERRESNQMLSPVKNVALAVQTLPLPITSSVTYVSVSSFPISAATATAAVTSFASTESSSQPVAAAAVADNKQAVVLNKPKRPGSVGLYFRKFYHLASVRLQDLFDRLSVGDDDLKRKMWTCFEHSIINHSDLMMDRHLDQLIMCSVYVMAKVSNKDLTFQEIMRCYRMQPQADSHVYRSVLLCTKKRRHSGSSDESKNDMSCSNSPVAVDREEDKEREENRKEQLMIRSSSTLPVPHPNSQPPTPTRLAGTSTSFDSEDRGDLIKFYNTIYVPKMQTFVLRFSAANKNKNFDSPPLSPLPLLKANPMSPRRRISTNYSVYISPMKRSVAYPLSPSRPFSYSFSSSPAKDLRDINKMLRQDERKVGKRILQDDNDTDSPSKRLCPDLTLRKIQNVITERQGANVPCD